MAAGAERPALVRLAQRLARVERAARRRAAPRPAACGRCSSPRCRPGAPPGARGRASTALARRRRRGDRRRRSGLLRRAARRATCRSMRSSSGPLSRRRWRAWSAVVQPHAGLPAPARARVGRGDEHEARRESAERWPAHDRHLPVLQRLAQRLERRPRELRQLVEEQHAVVGEARLAGTGMRAAADEAGRRRSCGAARGTAASATSPAPRRGAGPRRCGCASPRAPRRASAAAGCRRAAGRASSCRSRAGRRAGGCGRPPRRSSARGSARRARGRREVLDVRVPRLDGERWPAGARAARSPRRIAATPARSPTPATSSPSTSPASARALARDDEPVEPVAPRALGDRERARRTGAARRRARARRRPPSARRAPAGTWPLAARSPQAIARSKPGPCFAQVRGREVDGDAPARELEARVADRRVHALARLAHGGVAEADDREAREAGAQVDLDGDAPRVEAVDGEGGDAGEHGPDPRAPRVARDTSFCDECCACNS